MAQHRDQPMAHKQNTAYEYRFSKSLLTAITVATALLSGCASHDQLTTGGIPDDYRQRHPIVVAEAEQSVDIPGLFRGMRMTRSGCKIRHFPDG